jgi:hypothetical protein
MEVSRIVIAWKGAKSKRRHKAKIETDFEAGTDSKLQKNFL